ncbi:hypothetical protein AAHA92_13353 [Salvia divinorum]|uniref:Receptor ligand binding region domain-containing protein n=1 Tax=Salvia divinorum TaxID=28513 RepID=A0ABD1H7Z7_SALDI
MQANFMINLGDKARVPIMTFSASSSSLMSIRSPYFVRAALSDSSQVKAIGAIVQTFGWREAVPIYADDEFGQGILPFLADALELVTVHIPYKSSIPSSATDDQIVAELYNLMAMETRVFVVHMLTGLGSRLFTKAKLLGMMSEGYAWIITDGMANKLNSADPSAVEAMQFCCCTSNGNLEGFGVSGSGAELIRALSSTTFRGLAGEFELVEGQLQSPPYQIVNVISVGPRVVGYWTKGLSYRISTSARYLKSDIACDRGKEDDGD